MNVFGHGRAILHYMHHTYMQHRISSRSSPASQEQLRGSRSPSYASSCGSVCRYFYRSVIMWWAVIVRTAHPCLASSRSPVWQAHQVLRGRHRLIVQDLAIKRIVPSRCPIHREPSDLDHVEYLSVGLVARPSGRYFRIWYSKIFLGACCCARKPELSHTFRRTAQITSPLFAGGGRQNQDSS